MDKLTKFFNKKPSNNKIKKQKAYICATAFNHEVGDTITELLPANKLAKPVQEHKECGIYEVDVVYKKTIYKPQPFSIKNTLSIEELTLKQIKSTEELIKKKKDFLKKLKKQLNQLKIKS